MTDEVTIPRTRSVSKPRRGAQSTRSALMRSAQQLFTERGFAQVSIEMITRSVGHTEGAFFHHFKNKKSIYQLVVKKAYQQFQQQISQQHHRKDDALESLLEKIRLTLRLSSQSKTLYKVLREAPLYLEYDEWRDINADGLLVILEPELGTIAEINEIPSHQVRLMSLTLLGIINEYCYALARGFEGLTEDDMIDAFGNIISVWAAKWGKLQG